MGDTLADVPADRAESEPLAAELAGAYGRMVAFYRDQLELSGPEADARARGADDTPAEAAADLARIGDRPPDQVSWFDLNRVADRDPEAFAVLWRALKAAARDELDSGHRAARALDWDGRPWDRARYLAIRDSFRRDYRPGPGIEAALVDLAAEAFADYLAWSEQLHMQAGTEADIERNDLGRHGKWKPQRIFSAEAMANSARMAEQAHARFLRTVATLGDLRRTEPVYVGQVNIAPQQINIARLVSEDDE
ncbi:MAG: hypothetical protein H0T72_00065 [Chloroflexia bacterium]|nr:hypothetical protein [Chloroflexia bacterium]